MTGPRAGDRPRAVITIGVFDGVHLGHQMLIRRVVERAAELGVEAGCVTFHPHPEDVLRPESDIPHLGALEDRLEAIRELGISLVEVIPFTWVLARETPEQFVDRLLTRFILRELWVGSDFALGRGRSGTPDRLARIGMVRGFRVFTVPPVEWGGEVVSSSRIRALLAEGRVEEAAELLGRPYRLRGRVVPGDGRGRHLGFATANLAVDERLCVPGNGVYAVWAVLDGEQPRPAVANVGLRPTFDGSTRSIEVHLLDFADDLYGRLLAVDFVARLRGERRFGSVDALVEQIRQDITSARLLLAAGPPHAGA